jgi:hypothetical protein
LIACSEAEILIEVEAEPILSQLSTLRPRQPLNPGGQSRINRRHRLSRGEPEGALRLAQLPLQQDPAEVIGQLCWARKHL